MADLNKIALEKAIETNPNVILPAQFLDKVWKNLGNESLKKDMLKERNNEYIKKCN